MLSTENVLAGIVSTRDFKKRLSKMKLETYAAINDRTVEAVIKDVKARRLRGYESGGQWYVVPPQKDGKQAQELESECLGYFEQSRSLAKKRHWEAAYQSASQGLKIALEYLATTSR